MASGPPEHHLDRLGRRLADRSCNFVLAAEKRLAPRIGRSHLFGPVLNSKVESMAQQLRQLGDIRCDPPRLGRMYAGPGLLRSLIVRVRKRGRLPRDGLADLGS
jgi:hypothetical protein